MPEPIFPDFPNLPIPDEKKCDDSCLDGWRKFFLPLVPEGSIVRDYVRKEPLPRPDKSCDDKCLYGYYLLMLTRKARGRDSLVRPERAGVEHHPELDEADIAAAEAVLEAFGLRNFFDGPKSPATPSPRIPQGSVQVFEGPVYLDKGSASGPKSGPSRGGPPKSNGPGKGPSSGPAADDIGDWDTGNPYGFDTGAPATPPTPTAPEGPAKTTGVFKLIDDLLNFAQQ